MAVCLHDTHCTNNFAGALVLLGIVYVLVDIRYSAATHYVGLWIEHLESIVLLIFIPTLTIS